ncbi:MAG: hypothetical protein ACJA2N_001925 [Salibacteraceae bacterium]|jgi:hypothetical protein
MIFMGVPVDRVIIPDSFLAVRLYSHPDAYILHQKAEVLDEKVCNADFPDFNSELIRALSKASTSKLKTEEFSRYRKHMKGVSNDLVDFDSSRINIVMLLGSFSSNWPHPTSYYLKPLLEINEPDINIYYLFSENYISFNLSSFEFNKRRLKKMYMDGVGDIPIQVLMGYGIIEKK